MFAGPEWPDGSPPPPGSLWLVQTSGKGLHRLTSTGVRVQCCSNYRWSPDGKKILFADAGGILWTISPAGSNLTQVYRDDTRRWAITPTWSPDGSMIMFALDPTGNPFGHPRNSLYVVRANGTGLTKVLGGPNFKREPVWVPR
jgi:Tol biopolymer transport system component